MLAGHALGPVSVGLVPWSFARPGEAPRRYLTVVLRAQHRLVPGAPLVLDAAAPLAPREVLGPDGAVIEPGDLAPFLPRAELWLRGPVTLARPAAAIATRLLVVRRGAKVLLKAAELAVAPGARAARPLPYEPLARSHPARARLLGPLEAQALDDPRALALDTRTDLHGLHAAPLDQLAPALVGDESLVLDGFFAEAPRFETRLPGVLGVARVYGLARGPTPLSLRLDSVGLDLERRTARLVYRGNLELQPGDVLERVTAAAGLEAGAPLPFPATLAPPAAVAATAPFGGLDLSGTAHVDISAILAALPQGDAARPSALPFQAPAPTATPAAVPGLPFQAPPSPAPAPAPTPAPRDWGGTLGPEAEDLARAVLPFEGRDAGATLGFDGVSLADVLPFPGPPSAPASGVTGTVDFVPADPKDSAGRSGERGAPVAAAFVVEPLAPPPAPPADPSATIGFDGVDVAQLLAGRALPFSPDAAPAAAPEAPEPAKAKADGGMTLGFDGVSIDELLRPAMPFQPPEHLGPRPLVLLPRAERPSKKLSLFFLDALRALAGTAGRAIDGA